MALAPHVRKRFGERAETIIKNRENPMRLGNQIYYRILPGFTSKNNALTAANELRDMGYLSKVVLIKSRPPSITGGNYDLYARRA